LTKELKIYDGEIAASSTKTARTFTFKVTDWMKTELNHGDSKTCCAVFG
jgi:hypothetical protein